MLGCCQYCKNSCKKARTLKPGHIGWVDRNDFTYYEGSEIVVVNPEAQIHNQLASKRYLLSRDHEGGYEIEDDDQVPVRAVLEINLNQIS
jgi:hypothetical protein